MQTVKLIDKRVTIEDTLNPASYEILGRPMVFSEADMVAKNYNFSELTTIEQRIQETLRTTYRDMLYLSNYRDFDNEVLITAAAMTATFNFNREFSDYKVFGESSILYPQNFELKNFNYDAFMRLLLLNSTGEPLMGDRDLYVRILDNTSFFTGLLLLACDVMAVYAIPTFKIVVLLMLLLLCFAITLSCVLAPPPKIVGMVAKNLGLPALIFLVASVAFAFVISLFMGEGLTTYVGGRIPSLGITDPTITMGLMLVVDIVYLYVLWKVIKLLLDSFKAHLSTTFLSSVALVASAGSMMANKAMSLGKGALGGVGRGVLGAGKFAYKEKQYNKMLDAVEGVGSVGKGTGSSGNSSGASSKGATTSEGGVRPNGTTQAPSGRLDQKGIDELASKPVYTEKKKQPTIQKRTIGSRLVDFKYGLRNSGRKIAEAYHSVGDATASVKEKYKYVASGEAYKYARGAVRDVKHELKAKFEDKKAQLREYEAGRLVDEDVKMAERLENKKLSSRKRERLVARRSSDTKRFDSITDKMVANQEKSKLHRSRKTKQPPVDGAGSEKDGKK